jgi:hypothetical protein
MKHLTIGTTASDIDGTTPFAFDCVALNMTAAAITLSGSDDNTTFTDIGVVPTLGALDITDLPRYVKGSAAGVVLLGSL